MKGILFLILIALAALQPGSVYYFEDFSDISDWGLYAGSGSLSTGGVFSSNGSVAFKTAFPEFNVFSNSYEIIIDASNGSWAVWLIEATDGNLYHLINETRSGYFSAVMTSSLVVEGLVIAVINTVDFQSIKIFEGAGTGRGGIFGYLEGLVMDFVASNPWFMPIVLGIGVVVVTGLLVFGKSKKRG